MSKTIVLGTTYSGSGAVFDFLKGRLDSFLPLGDSEYLLPHVPYGLMQLRSACSEAFHYSIAHEAFVRFRDIAFRLARSPKGWVYGGGYEKLLPGFTKEIDALVDALIDSRMPMKFVWDRIMYENQPVGVLSRLGRKLGSSKTIRQPKRFLPVEPGKINERIREMHDRLFVDESDRSKFILLNQAGSGWNPHQSTDFYSQRRVIVVTRDPRDQFAELRKFKGSTNVWEFIKWFRNLQSRTVTGNPEIMYVGFEDFVLNHDLASDSVLRFLGLPSDPSSYNPSESEENIGRYRAELTREESVAIEEALRDNFPTVFHDS